MFFALQTSDDETAPPGQRGFQFLLAFQITGIPLWSWDAEAAKAKGERDKSVAVAHYLFIKPQIKEN